MFWYTLLTKGLGKVQAYLLKYRDCLDPCKPGFNADCPLSFVEKIFQEYHQGVKQFGQDKAQHSVGPDLSPNCLQRLSVDYKCSH